MFFKGWLVYTSVSYVSIEHGPSMLLSLHLEIVDPQTQTYQYVAQKSTFASWKWCIDSFYTYMASGSYEHGGLAKRWKSIKEDGTR